MDKEMVQDGNATKKQEDYECELTWLWNKGDWK